MWIVDPREVVDLRTFQVLREELCFVGQMGSNDRINDAVVVLIIRSCVDTCWKTFKIILLSNIVYLVNIDTSDIN